MDYNYYKQVYPTTGIFYHLDIGSVTDKEYDELKPIIEHLGGHWREKVKCFVFGEDVHDKLDCYIKNGVDISEKYKWQEETQFYPTPDAVAKRVIELAEIKEGQRTLEPSAGCGNLLDCISLTCDILAIEPMLKNYNVLKEKGYFTYYSTFEEVYSHKKLGQFDRVVMNPPFSGQRDIEHVLMAYNLLKSKGVLVAIISENALYYTTKKSMDFLKFLNENNSYIEPVPSCSFAESGTTIETVIVKLVKE